MKGAFGSDNRRAGIVRLTAAWLAALGALSGCNDDSDLYEELDRMRVLGVAASPLIAAPSDPAGAPQTVTLTLHASVPAGLEVAAEVFNDPLAKYSVPAPLAMVAGSATYEDHEKLRLYRVSATITVPTAAQLGLDGDALAAKRFARLRYGIRLAAPGDDGETAVGDVLVYPAGAPELAWTSPVITVTSPTAGGPVSGDADLNADITDPNDEQLRVGWFVTEGKVKNRRARTTEWETPGAGVHTVIATVRGRKSGGFSLQAVDVTVE